MTALDHRSAPDQSRGVARRPLDGCLVVALEQAVAAPMASRRLADAGARVIKIERPEGDFARAYDHLVLGESAYFVWLNRGKESVVADLACAEGKRLVRAIIARADVLIQNLKPGALAKLGIPVAELRKANPRLIACSISGYGETGPYADRKAYDLLVQAEAGLAAVTGGPEAPSRVGISIVDIATGLHAYEAILEALLRRARTGVGAEIQLSMFDCVAELMGVPIMYGSYGRPPARIGLAHPSLAPYGVFMTKDSVPILISIQNEREWKALAERVLGRPDAVADPRFSTSAARVANRPATDGLVADWFAARDHGPVIAALSKADIAFGRVNDIPALLEHPHLRMMDVTTPSGPTRVPALPALWDGVADPPAVTPALGADTARVMTEFLGG
jgi:formyl-CoA transferase